MAVRRNVNEDIQEFIIQTLLKERQVSQTSLLERTHEKFTSHNTVIRDVYWYLVRNLKIVIKGDVVSLNTSGR